MFLYIVSPQTFITPNLVYRPWPQGLTPCPPPPKLIFYYIGIPSRPEFCASTSRHFFLCASKNEMYSGVQGAPLATPFCDKEGERPIKIKLGEEDRQVSNVKEWAMAGGGRRRVVTWETYEEVNVSFANNNNQTTTLNKRQSSGV